MSYLVTSPLVLVRVPDQVGDGYRLDYHYQGSVIPWLSDEQAEHFLTEGLVEEDGEGAVDPGADPTAGPPAKTALKEVWVAYVVAKTADTEEPVSFEDADQMSKADLIELYG